MILKIGSRGKQVIELQTLLGIKNPDGIFGKITNQKVVEFQKAHNLNPDGLVGSKTWSKLLEKKESKIIPVYNNINTKEDFSDPEEEMLVSSDKENTPTSNYVYELINLIQKTNITRSINRVIFHCTATQPNATIASIKKYWKESLNWDNPGYHIIVKADGSWTQLQDFNKPTNGVKGYNSKSIHISYIGGIDSEGNAFDSRTPEQLVTLEDIYILLKEKLKNVTFHGHYEFSSKACPSFNVKQWIDSIEKKI